MLYRAVTTSRRRAGLSGIWGRSRPRSGTVKIRWRGPTLLARPRGSFSVEDKLRTVLWLSSGAKLPQPAREVLNRLTAEADGALGQRLGWLLSRDEL